QRGKDERGRGRVQTLCRFRRSRRLTFRRARRMIGVLGLPSFFSAAQEGLAHHGLTVRPRSKSAGGRTAGLTAAILSYSTAVTTKGSRNEFRSVVGAQLVGRGANHLHRGLDFGQLCHGRTGP